MEERGYFEYKFGERVYMPEDITFIERGFYDLYYNEDEENPLFRVHIPSTVKRIGDQAFYCVQSLLAVSFAGMSHIEHIGAFAFAQCYDLERFDFKGLDCLKIIEQGAFSHTRLKDVDLSKCPLMFVGPYAFGDNTHLLHVTWCERELWDAVSADAVPHRCFVNCENLISFSGDSCYDDRYLEYIGSNAFKGCNNIQEFKVHPDCKIGEGNEVLNDTVDCEWDLD